MASSSQLKDQIFNAQEKILSMVHKIEDESAYTECINEIYKLQNFIEKNENKIGDENFVDTVYEFIDKSKGYAFSWKLKKDNTRMTGIHAMMSQLNEVRGM